LPALTEHVGSHYIIRPAAAAYDAAKMPSLFRFLAVVGLLIGLAYGVIYALASLVEPTQREITITVPRDVLNKPR
jgi:cobalamin synthase